ncbi:la ribonucleoprotein translational regulator Achilles isoform X6 [Temnothorax americanus]|uniref:la ribonucleoprotein translational regulator Achilles isoform X6 n=1 Tax=Temnothorax americanus TaxID=1964332 RepID=UPI0040694ACC
MELEVSQDLKERRTNDLPSSPHPRMKNVEKKDSISSVDSDLSLSFDRRGSKSDEADLSDYDSEIRFVKERDRDQDSGADSVDDAASKEVIQVERQVDVPSDAPTDAARATVEKTTTAFVRPTDELADKICAQVEYYFSDENIIKDAFLLKHVKRNKEGYVSLKLISSFKKVKHLSRDWRAVGAALTRSKKLEINSQGTKLRRVTPLPPFDQTAPSRTILAAGLPIENVTVDAVAEIFKPCGEIALIRVLKPGRPIPPEVRQAIAKRPDVASIEECAMVEFTDSASTRRAMQMALGDAKVFELRHLVDKKRKHQPAKKCSLTRVAREDTHTNSSSCPSGSEPEDGRVRLQRGFQGYPRCHVHNTSYPFQGPPSPDTCLSLQTRVDVTPPARLVPKQLSFIQVTRIRSIIMKIAVTLAVLPLDLRWSAGEVAISQIVVDRPIMDRYQEDSRHTVAITIQTSGEDPCALQIRNIMFSIAREARTTSR